MSVLLWVFVGYCLGTWFPVPWLNPYIVDGWRKILGIAKPVVDSVTTKTDTTPKS